MYYLIIIGIFIVIIATTIYGSLMSQKWHKEHRGKDITSMDGHFHWKVFYFNPEDKRVFVPKKSGAGYTVNFANPVSLLTGVLLMSGIALILGFPDS